MSCKVYTCKKMTGRTGKELVVESLMAKQALTEFGLEVLDPVDVEGVKPTKRIVAASDEDLKKFWKRDKEMIREADVILDLSGPEKSEGVAHEIGYARYCLWMPVVRIYPKLGPSVARLEDDIIVPNVWDAAPVINIYWGTRRKRVMWRLRMLYRSLPKWLNYQLARLFK